MRTKSFYIKTLKEQPADSDIPSYGLMIRSGMIKKLSSGIYTYMPLGLRVLRKIENIIRLEMNLVGGVEILTPIVQPSEIWKTTNRWETLGDELLRVKDRHKRDFVIQPTSEEVFTEIIKQEIKSWKQLPIIFYQIQTKFRDERRPRFGIMRAREFIMKDAYSFDIDKGSADKTYEIMLACYKRIFAKIGLDFRIVRADTGSIGGTKSDEFQVIANTGEDLIAYSKDTDFSENLELTEAVELVSKRELPQEDLTITNTPGVYKCADVAAYLKVHENKIVKSLLVVTQDKSDSELPTKETFWLILLRSNHSLNELKLSKIPEFSFGWRFAYEEEILENTGASSGSIGPVNLNKTIKVLSDRTVAKMSDFIVGANKDEFHYVGVNWGRDLEEPMLIHDLRNVEEGDPLPNGKGKISIQRGIEVGHIFYLGDKYSKSIGAGVFNEKKIHKNIEMGCYGIGVSRLIAAAIEQNHDDRGIIWPKNIAPFSIVICPISGKSDSKVFEIADRVYDSLISEGFDVILDDRSERPGVMFAEWELIGIPIRITIGSKSIERNCVEIFLREKNLKFECSMATLVATLKNSFN